MIVLTAIAVLIAWSVGQIIQDRWVWSQWLFWIPAWIALIAALCALRVRRMLRSSLLRSRLMVLLLIAAAVCSTVRMLRTELGLVLFPSTPSTDSLVLVHWNPQWPGESALSCGRALQKVHGDVVVVSNPGSMFRAAVRNEWIADDAYVADVGTMGVVSRFPIERCSLLVARSIKGIGNIWVAWIEIECPSGELLKILAIDLPSSPFIARSEIATALAVILQQSPPPASPDVVVGDFNSTLGGAVCRVLASDLRPAPPWAATGWLATFSRPWPLLRIDFMLAGPRLQWQGFRVRDLGFSDHCAQRGVLQWRTTESDTLSQRAHLTVTAAWCQVQSK